MALVYRGVAGRWLVEDLGRWLIIQTTMRYTDGQMRWTLCLLLCSLATAQTLTPSLLKLVEWRQIGPSRGGRVEAVAGDPSKPLVFYFGATGGGVWKTEDAGITWRNLSDGQFQTGSVGAIAVAPSNPDVIYVGMGEACFRGDTSHGDGVYKSTDGGKTWTNVGLAATRHIARIRIHPKDPDTVYVAAFGDGFGPSPDRGVFRTPDGGKSWKKVLYRDENSGAIDLTLDAGNPRLLYASLLEFRRFPWAVRSGGAGTGLFKSTDGGDTWTELTNNPGLPGGLKGRIGIAQSPAKPDRVWAIVDAETGKKGVFRTDDGGGTWQRISDYAELTQRPWYYHHIFADPKDPDTVYVLNIGAWKSTDGGKTWQAFRPPHGDHHDLWIDPANPERMIEGNDGGGTISLNGGKSWSTLLNQPTAQIYHVVSDNQFPYHVCGAQQDNSSICLPVRSDYGSISLAESFSPANSESGYLAINTKDPNIIYMGDHHWLYRYDHRTHQSRDISPNPETHYGWGAADINFRFQWTFPVMTSPHDSRVLYTTSQFVHRTTNEGQSWERISPDLTRHDPSKLEKTPYFGNEKVGEYWGPITRDNTGVEWYSTVFAFAESPIKKDLLWAGSDDGYVHVSVDGGRKWRNVTPKNLPDFALISIVEPSWHDPAVAYVAATRYKLQDRKPYLFKTTDYGSTWTQITTGIPDGDFTRVIREDPARRGMLYAGTETGVYVSNNDGVTWQSFRLNLPAVPVHDLLVHRSQKGLSHDLIAATHGRGFWVIDDVALLQQVQAPVTALFPPPQTVRVRVDTALPGGVSGDDPSAGKNPPSGVLIPYFLEGKPTEPVVIVITDSNGKEIRKWSSADAASESAGRRGRPASVARVTTEPGANRFIWNMLYPAARVTPGTTLPGPPLAPMAPSGLYHVSLTVDGKTYTEPFRIVTDPRVPYPEGELAEQFSFLMAVRDLLTRTHDAVREIRDARKKAEEWAAQGGEDRKQEVAAFNDRLYPIEERLTQYRAKAGQDLSNYPVGIDSKLVVLGQLASKGDAPPTEQSYERFRELSEAVAKYRTAAEEVIRGWKH